MYNCNEVDVSKSGHYYFMAAPTVRVSNKSVSQSGVLLTVSAGGDHI